MRVTVTAIGHFDVDLPLSASRDKLWDVFFERYGTVEGWVACDYQDGDIDVSINVFGANQPGRNADIEVVTPPRHTAG